MTNQPRFRVGIDIGGTFTDIVFLDPEGGLHTKKVSSSVDNYAHAIVEGLREVFREVGLQGADVGEVIHGTTVASNAILERQGAHTGLITTKGFRDVLELRRLRMPRLYDLTWEKPAPLVERYLRAEVDERINARGEVLRPLDPADVERALDGLLREGIEALAVCLINSYANAAHEELIEEIVRRRAPKLPVCISARVLPEIREYERTSTTVINTYVMPVVERYLTTLRAGLGEIEVAAPLLIMQSNGGLMTAEAAAGMPMHIIESGPAAGVVGSQALARRMGLPKVITFDMGGTTAKASIVEDGEVNRAAEYQVGGGIMLGSRLLTGAGYLIRVPAIDLAEVGAGGGSIVWIDAGGALQVGPRSAGAYPGPLCYDLGGTEPTISDANVILGYLNPNYLVGGAVKLNAARARDVFEDRIATSLGLPLEQAAYGAHLIAASNMIRAIKAVSSERGRDPREYVLFAFGGNGPLFAAGMARQLEIRKIVVPPAPGLFSSFGLLYSDVEHHYVRTYRRSTRQLDTAELNEIWRRMEAEGSTSSRRRSGRSTSGRTGIAPGAMSPSSW
jgi:N-methylhydantoinase A